MATKRKSTKRKSTTRRKVGSVHHHSTKAAPKRKAACRKVGALSSTVEIILGAIGGSIATRIVSENIPAPKAGAADYRPYTGLVLGAAANYFGKKNLLIRSMAIGAIVEGSRAVIKDEMLLPLKVIKGNNLPYTTGTGKMGKKRMNRLMGINNGLAGKRPMIIGATSTPNALAGHASVFGYDGF